MYSQSIPATTKPIPEVKKILTREQAREHINALIGYELPRARKRIGGYDTFICPFCGNGSGSDGTGISTRDGRRYTCFKGCFTVKDYLDILKLQHGTNSENDIFAIRSLEIGGVSSTPTTKPANMADFFASAHSAITTSEAVAFLASRGISIETAIRFGLGYCPNWQSPTALRSGKNPPSSRRLIIPTGAAGYTARTIEGGTPDKYRFMKEGEAGYFGRAALYGTVPVFIVEGAIDALSISEAGGAACALGSTSGVDKFLAMVDNERPTVPLVLSLDNDKAGQDAQAKLRSALEARAVSFYEINTSGEYKDPNEHLTSNRDAFVALVNSDLTDAARQEAEAEKDSYLATSAAHHINALMGQIAASADTPAIPTGFAGLDSAFDGGLYEGLYVMGAISSLGKTTFLLQVADQVAMAGHDVLIFSLEMSRFELMAKSISRLTFENCGGTIHNAKSTRGILAGAKRRNYSRVERDLINLCISAYADYSERLFIHEGVGNIDVEEIKLQVQRHIAYTGNRPVVIIDYLQILAHYDMRASDKQNTDKAVLELKRLSRDKKIPVIAISSFNRDNYTAPVNLASFKESGAIEYSSDILFGLQLDGMDELSQSDGKRADTIRQIEEKKKADPRRAQIKILKNRNGKIGVSLYYDYYAMFNCFKER